jgi:hypothetical protein
MDKQAFPSLSRDFNHKINDRDMDIFENTAVDPHSYSQYDNPHHSKGVNSRTKLNVSK